MTAQSSFLHTTLRLPSHLISTLLLLLLSSQVVISEEQQQSSPPPPLDDTADVSTTTKCSAIDTCFSYGCPFHPLDIIKTDERSRILRLGKEETKDNNIPKGGCTEGKDVAVLTLTGFKGANKQQINQDRAFVVSPFLLTSTPSSSSNILLGVFDGHGNRGEEVSEYALGEIPLRLSAALASVEEEEEVVKGILKDVFVGVDRDVPTKGVGGCTASIVMKLGDAIYIANAGDSRSFLISYTPSTQKTSILYASREDKPDLPDEKQRVESMGGQVYIPPKKGTSRVIAGRTGLAMSRSIGDWDHGKVGVIPDPIVDVVRVSDVKRTGECVDADGAEGEMNSEEKQCDSSEGDIHLFAISATDGLLDAIEPEDFSDRIARSLYAGEGAPHVLVECDKLIVESAQIWGTRYRDDIAIAVSKIATL